METRRDIHIPEPCHEDWTRMNPVGKGRFCHSCSKVVVDFTKMNNDEILRYFTENARQRVCGRFTSGQVNTPITSTQVKVPTFDFFKHPLRKTAGVLVAGFALLVSACKPATVGEVTMGKPMPPDTASVIDRSEKSEQICEPKNAKPEKAEKISTPHKPAIPETIGNSIIIGDTILRGK